MIYFTSQATSFRNRAIISDPNPDPIPLMKTICSGSLTESLRVQLFSKPQQVQARMMKSDPADRVSDSKSLTDSRKHDARIRVMATHSLLLMNSLNNTSAMMEVATISKFPKRDTVEELVLVRPIMSNIGAATSRRTIRMTKGRSLFDKLASTRFILKAF
jgi:hypothetical protein